MGFPDRESGGDAFLAEDAGVLAVLACLGGDEGAVERREGAEEAGAGAEEGLSGLAGFLASVLTEGLAAALGVGLAVFETAALGSSLGLVGFGAGGFFFVSPSFLARSLTRSACGSSIEEE